MLSQPLLGWTGLRQAVLGWTGLRWAVLRRVKVDCTYLVCYGLDSGKMGCSVWSGMN